MSSSGNARSGGGKGPECLGASGPILCTTGVTTTIVIIATDATQCTCTDGDDYPFKVIVLYGGKANSVRCCTKDQVDQLRRSGELAQARFCEMKSVPEAIAEVISCPPPTVVSIADVQADIYRRLAMITAWMQREPQSLAAGAGGSSTVAA
jgi:hypothetical protein